MTHHVDSIAQQASVDLLLATLHSIHPESTQAPMEEWFHRYAIPMGYVDIAGADLCDKLRGLLAHLESGSVGGSLTAAVHASILALTQKSRCREAVDQESRRQVYNVVYGITHEINKPLANIAARAQQLMATCKDSESLKSLGTIVDQSMRAHEMLAESMNAVRPAQVELGLVNITSIITESAERVRKEHRNSNVEIYTHPMSPHLFSKANHGVLVEVLDSLLKNSLDACGPGDRIDLIAEPLEPDDPDSAKLDCPFGEIRIAVRDTGRGISSTDLIQVWDLYYSGRESGRGLGISLAKARRSIEGFGGKIWMVSGLNAGTTIEIRLALEPPAPRVRQRITL